MLLLLYKQFRILAMLHVLTFSDIAVIVTVIVNPFIQMQFLYDMFYT